MYNQKEILYNPKKIQTKKKRKKLISKDINLECNSFYLVIVVKLS